MEVNPTLGPDIHRPNNGSAIPNLPAEATLTLPPLNISGLVVTKADLMASLRMWIPQLTDISALDDDRFVLSVGAMPPEKEG